MTRRLWVLCHRWVGLALAAILIVAGTTGSILAFHEEIERALNPRLFASPAAACGALDVGALAVHAEQHAPQARVISIYLAGSQGATYAVMEARRDPLTGASPSLGFNHLLLDPCTGAEIGRRDFGAITRGWIDLMPFIYKLHYELALGEFGLWLFGIGAVLWTLDCFVAAYLTLPPRRRGHAGVTRRSFWRRWWPAWKVKWPASSVRVNFDIHRAGGLWLWTMLLIFAWSSVYMNLWSTVYTPVMQTFFDYRPPWTELPKRNPPLTEPRLGWREAAAASATLLAQEAQARGFAVESPVSLRLNRHLGVYQYQARTSLDVQDRRGFTRLFMDADSGELKLLQLPAGQYAGNSVTAWLYALHTGNVFGLPWRIFVCVLGLFVVALNVTGVLIWLKKREARKANRVRVRALAPSTNR